MSENGTLNWPLAFARMNPLRYGTLYVFVKIPCPFELSVESFFHVRPVLIWIVTLVAVVPGVRPRPGSRSAW